MEVKNKNCNVCGAKFKGNTSVAKCPKCRAAYLRKWKKEHPEKIAVYAVEYQKNNGEYIKQYKRVYRSKNPEQARESLREWKKRNPDKVLADGRKQDAKRLHKQERKDYMKDLRLRKEFNISLETYKLLLESQKGLCAICHKAETHLDRAGKLRQLCVDHCHKTGKVRQLLCNRCNSMLGRAEDDATRLANAAAYLKRHAK